MLYHRIIVLKDKMCIKILPFQKEPEMLMWFHLINFIKNLYYDIGMKRFILIILVLIAIIITGCSTKYVCYDGKVQNDAKKCPKVPVPEVTDIAAGIAMDNFGYAVASAKQEAYKRVNLYSQNGSFYSSVVFGNSETKSYKQLLFKIDGKTADVSCVSGCDYLTAN